MDRLTVYELLKVVSYAGDLKDLVNQYKQAITDVMRENERLKEENELFRKGFGLAQTIKDFRNKHSDHVGDANDMIGKRVMYEDGSPSREYEEAYIPLQARKIPSPYSDALINVVTPWTQQHLENQIAAGCLPHGTKLSDMAYPTQNLEHQWDTSVSGDYRCCLCGTRALYGKTNVACTKTMEEK